MNKAVQSIIKEYGTKKLMYSFLTFDSQQDVRLRFKTKFASKFNLKDYISNIRYTPPIGYPNLERALSKAKAQFSILEGHRPDAAKVVIVLIDVASASSDDDLRRIIDQYEKDKIKVVPVIIGNEVSTPDVLSIAFDKNKDNVVVTTTKENPDRLGKRIMDLVHKGTYMFSILVFLVLVSGMVFWLVDAN